MEKQYAIIKTTYYSDNTKDTDYQIFDNPKEADDFYITCTPINTEEYCTKYDFIEYFHLGSKQDLNGI